MYGQKRVSQYIDSRGRYRVKGTAFKFCSTLFQREASLYEIDFLLALLET